MHSGTVGDFRPRRLDEDLGGGLGLDGGLALQDLFDLGLDALFVLVTLPVFLGKVEKLDTIAIGPAVADAFHFFEHLAAFLLLAVLHLAGVGADLEGLVGKTAGHATLLAFFAFPFPLPAFLHLENRPLANANDAHI
jgi:hypothetical protein